MKAAEAVVAEDEAVGGPDHRLPHRHNSFSFKCGKCFAVVHRLQTLQLVDGGGSKRETGFCLRAESSSAEALCWCCRSSGGGGD